MKVVTAATMREMDRRTIDEFHTPGIVLMENAALRVVETIALRYGPLVGKRVVVLCGKGNNGGDGLAVARHLWLRFGSAVDVWTAFDADATLGDSDSAANLRMAHAAGVPIRNAAEPDFDDSLMSADIVVDALFGTGFHGKIDGLPAKMVEAVNRVRGADLKLGSGSSGAAEQPQTPRAPVVVSIDIPSGVDADTGDTDGPAVQADLTVTFALAKPGLICYPGASNVGELVIGDIGMPRQVIDEAPAFAFVTEAVDIARSLPDRENARDSNKGKFGHVVVFAGSRGFMGAANMSSHSAARSGAGLVTLAVPESLLPAAMTAASPVVMTKGLPESEEGTFAKSAVDEALKLCEKATAVALGPGIGAHNPGTSQFVIDFVKRCPLPMIVDADALTVLASEPDHGASIIASRAAHTILTPHPGEMGRLAGMSTAEVQASRFDIVREAAERFRCTVLLKGSRTLIASPGATIIINVTGNAGMATGGAGDVLTGVVGALLGMKLDPHAAASSAAYVHGLAGDIAAEEIGGNAGLVATDILDHLPAAIGRCLGS